MEDDPLWKKTSKMKSRNISSTICPICPILLKYEILAYRAKLNVIETLNEDNLSWKMTPLEEDLKNKTRNISATTGPIFIGRRK